MLLNKYQGRILVSQPKCQSTFFRETAVLTIKHNNKGAWGVIINKPIPDLSCDLADILEHIGIENAMGINAPLYVGGPIERSRVCIVHSTDWASTSTIEITPDLSVTTDISILTALAGGQGPSQYRAFCGLSSWGPGQLEGEMSGEEPWTPNHRWLDLPADCQSVLEMDPAEQWSSLLQRAVELEVKEWF